MEFTGERFMPTEQGKIRLEHYHRYAAVLDIVPGKKVLDVACGEGYGSALIAKVALEVSAVDISDEAVQHAIEKYSYIENLYVSQGSATALNFPDASFDVVISFETIEHLASQAEMLAELSRVLRSDGVLIISSPNRPVYSEESGEHNQFHVKELDFAEFDELLKTQFSVVEYYGQRIMMGSVLQALDTSSASYEAWSDNGESVSRQSAALRSPVYFVAVCGGQAAALPKMRASVTYPESVDLVNYYVGFAKWAQVIDREWSASKLLVSQQQQSLEKWEAHSKEARAHLEEMRVNLEEMRINLEEMRANLLAANGILDQRDNQLKIANATIADWEARAHVAESARAALSKTFSWRITLPVREARRWALTPKQQARRYWSILTGLVGRPAASEAAAAREAAEALEAAAAAKAAAFLKAAAAIQFPICPRPTVSVVIPVYGKIEFTLACLASIQKNLPTSDFEIIVVDDASPDDSADFLAHVSGIRVIRSPKNQGFIRSCNLGAQAAQGDYLCFLNNDTEVCPGWVDELVLTFENFPGTGLAGSKLIYPDGRLQEAGGIIWEDGSAWNYGRFQDPDLPVYCYAREVDYCSGASIMIPKALFVEVGGFDTHYLPAYCEDSDLALKLRDHGYRVIYQSQSIVVHHEGITSGTDVTQGTKAYQIENTKKLFERWQHRLKQNGAAGVDVDSAKDRGVRRRVLVLDHCTPAPDKDAGSLTTFNMMLLLREMGFQVTFIPESNYMHMPIYTAALQRVGVEVLYAPQTVAVDQHLAGSGHRYDLVFMFRPGVVMRHIMSVRHFCSKAKVLFHTIDLHHLRMQREAELANDVLGLKHASEMRRCELAALRTVDASIVHSTTELELLRPELDGETIVVFPLILNVPGTSAVFEERRDIVFVGGYQHLPNVDAVKFFVADVMPVLREKLPGVRFFIAGSHPPPEVQALACADVVVTGFVEDLNPLLDQMRVSIAPLRYGAGIKGKIGTAMAAGLPVVASSLAAEGMSLTNGENILVADGIPELAGAIERVYCDPSLWEKLSKAGPVFAENAWGRQSAWNILAGILETQGLLVEPSLRELKVFSSRTMGVNDKGISGAKALTPVFVAHTRAEYEQGMIQSVFAELYRTESHIIENVASDSFSVRAFCKPCDAYVEMHVDLGSGGVRVNNLRVPNWREQLVCPLCQMNNRQRLIASLIKKRLENTSGAKIYFMEQVTPIYRWAQSAFPQHEIIGSEYLGYEYQSGDVINGIRHEDVTGTSFPDASLDLIVSNDVFEHVPNPKKAFEECSRILRVEGVMLATIPFHSNKDISVSRAELGSTGIDYLLPKIFHGNPVSAEGALVFTDFGWDILACARTAGFMEMHAAIYSSISCAHLGGGQIIFEARRS